MGGRTFDAVASAIADHGPITFAEYMDIALYGPGGFYERPPVGPSGDFVTSPHVHPVFGELLAEAIHGLWRSLGEPDPFHVVEAGAGDGTSMRQYMPALDGLPIRFTAVERSAGARGALASIEDLTVLESLPADAPGVVLAHELLDNLSFRRLRGTDDGPCEVRVTIDGGTLSESLTPIDEHFPGPHAPDLDPGREQVIPTGAIAFARDALRHGPRFLLAIDYGSDGGSGEVHGYRGHRVIEDVLAHTGETDITAGVDFAAIADALIECGHHVFPSVSQHRALAALGFTAWLHTQLERQTDLLATGRGGDAVRTWGGRSRATMLADPAGLGRYVWFLAASSDLPEPAWLTRASEARHPLETEP